MNAPSAPSNQGKTWTPEDERHIVALLRAGRGLTDIAQMLGRTEGAVLARMEQMQYAREKFDAARKVLLAEQGSAG